MRLRGALLAAILTAPLIPQSSVTPLQSSLLLFNSGKYGECYQIVSSYVLSNPSSGPARKLLGMDEFMLGKRQEALQELQRATELMPRDTEAFYYLGRLYFEADNAPAALTAFQKAVELDPSNVRARNNMGQSYEAMGRLLDAERSYLRAIEVEKGQAKKSGWPSYNLGLLYFNSGRSDRAVSCFREALASNPGFSEAKIKLAALLSDENEARGLLEEAVRSDPQNAEAHYRLALLLTKSGMRDEAQRHFALFEKYRKL
ncbi:MAG: tetratricopeptide repeat protein [Bryobacteraceae bacterium]